MDYADILTNLILIDNKIKTDTDKFFESHFAQAIPEMTISYKGVAVQIPLDLAETDYMQDVIKDLIKINIEDYTGEEMQ